MYHTDEYVAAIKGEAVPSELIGDPVLICCLVRGIRYYDGFAQELYGNSDLPMVTRALNARAIMSNRVPMMTAPEQFPYCFWYPEVPREETLRQLLAQYPSNTLLRYQVGRASAVGVYSSLYHELGLLPDVAIAEEARDNLVSGQLIYDAIMNAPIRYTYMDDYNCCLRPQPIAGAWEGNIDRYARLRRPRLIEGEIPCVVRGIHQHPLFAKWWLTQRYPDTADFIVQAIHARCVMNNDLSWLTGSTLESELPDLIWYPQVADKATYRELVRRRPSMALAVARACVHADYEDLFSSLDFIPDKGLFLDASANSNEAYLQLVELKAGSCGIDLDGLLFEPEDWTGVKPHVMLEQDQAAPCYGTQSMYLTREITLDHVGFRPEELATVPSTIGQVLLHASVADPAIRPRSPYEYLHLRELYENRPRVECEANSRMIGLHAKRGGLYGHPRGRGRGRE